MGLDFSHGDVSFAYSGFNRFRTRLAKDIGIDLNSMVGFRGDIPWEQAPRDPLLPLLNHSDCDGELTPEECKSIAPRLREIVNRWTDDPIDRTRGLQLADAMDEAAAAGEPLEFH